MAKTISNKKYEEFWNNDDLSIKSEEKIDNKSVDNKDDIRKQVKREVKKEVKKLEEQVKELSEKIVSSESIEDQSKPKRARKPKVKQDVEVDNSVEEKVELIQDISDSPLTLVEEPVIEEPIIELIPETMDELIEEQLFKEEIIIVENPIEETVQHQTNKELYEKYSLDEQPYKIFFRGNLLYNSINHTQKPIFEDDGFILFGKKYIYRGIRFEKY